MMMGMSGGNSGASLVDHKLLKSTATGKEANIHFLCHVSLGLLDLFVMIALPKI